MPYFEYTARDKNGKALKGQLFAVTKQQLITNLQREGLLILSMKEAAAIAERKTSQKMHKKAKTKDLMLFAKELAVLLENGIPVMECIDVLIKQMSSINLMIATKAIRKDLENGSTLANAVAKNPLVFSSIWHYLIDAGETSGQLPFVLRQMVMYLESRELIKKKTINAMLYPAVLFTVAIFAVALFTFKIIPIFRNIYITFNAVNKLPPLTKFILACAEIITKFYILLIIAIIVVVFIFKQIVATRSGRRAYESAIMHSPILGNIYLALVLERFASTLRILLKSGIPIIKAMEMAANTSQSRLFAEKLEEAKAKVVGGLPFSEALQQTTLFPPLSVQLIAIAEKTGNYAGMFEEVASYYHEILDTAITRFTSLIEPVMLVLMAIVIGILVIGMYLPIFGLANL